MEGDTDATTRKLVTDPSKTQLLESYWDAHKAPQDGLHLPTESSSESLSTLAQNPAGRQPGKPKHNRNRSASDGTALLRSGHSLSVNHPAWSLSSLATTFGPLIFRIYRAALLRKRILLSCHAPVRQVCDFGKDPSIPGRFYLADPPRTVYGLSVISNIPIAVSNLLSESAPPRRIRPLFTIGVHDIPYLEEDLRASKPAGRSTANEAEISEDLDPAGHGWIACTTDGILAVKETLYDILITLPPPQTEHDQERAWPKVQSSQGVHLMATQRDLRRYNIFKWALSQSSGRTENSQQKQNTEEDSRQSIPPQLTSWNPALFDYRTDTDSIVEPLSWSALAYSGFMWWASAGERQISMDDEFEQDSALLEGLGFERPSLRPSIASPDAISSAQNTDCTANHEMAIIAYFHRLTTSILTVLSDIIDATDSDDEREDARLTNSGDDEDLDGPAVFVSSADITKMGLDSWSKTDQEFIEELVRLYFGRKARVEGNSVDVCGVRIC